MKKFSILLTAFFTPSLAFAGPRTSANYSIATDTADAGGQRAASASYANDGSAGGATGLSTVAAPAETVKSGYIAQLYDVTGLTLTATLLSVNEGATDQLGAWQLLDDASYLAAGTNAVAWSVVNGPLTGISGSGLATAGLVYQNTPAIVQGIFAGNTGTLQLTVVDSIPDNFGAYAGDGLPDDWQVRYFGQNNASGKGGPNDDYSGTGQTNLFKFIAGLNPIDPTSRFTISIAPVPGQSGQKKVIFTPVIAGRTYQVTAKTNLTTNGAWTAINASAPSDIGLERTITDLSASGSTKFYRVEITKP